MPRGSIAALTLALALLAPPSQVAAQAEQPDAATQEAARALGRAGLARYDKRDWAGALEKFQRAYALYRAPTLGLMLARCQARLGKLAQASETYQDVVQIEVSRSAHPSFREAQKNAAYERAALLPRIPKLTIVLDPAEGEAASLTIDGAPRTGGVAGPHLLDPGTHEVEVRRGQASARKSVTLREGDNQRLVIRVGAEAAPTTPPIQGHGKSGPEGIGAPSEGGAPGGAQRAIGWTALGLGAAGVTAGAILAGVAASKRGDLDAGGCVDGKCLPQLTDDVDTYNTLRIASGIGLIAGGAVLAAGGVLLFTAPSSEPASKGTAVAPSVGWGSIGLSGRF